jgi:ribosomal protein S18 acetylase RimI-like enzyme
MTITIRPCTSEADVARMRALVNRFPDGNVHVIDLPYRLSSWAMDYPQNVGLWEDGNGHLRAWAVLQTPFWALDYALDAAARADGVHGQILEWATRQARQIADGPSGRPCWFVSVRSDQADGIADLERAEFRRLDRDPENPWSKVFMRRSGNEPVSEVSLPTGFCIRPHAGLPDVEASVALHRDAFGTANMTVAWRERTLRQPDYHPDLDLVVKAPDGRLVAFCIAWLSPTGFEGRPAGQIEPLGVHPDFRHRGLGRAVLSEGLRRLQDHGAEAVFVETDDDRDAAYSLYQSSGFQTLQKIFVFRTDVA